MKWTVVVKLQLPGIEPSPWDRGGGRRGLSVVAGCPERAWFYWPKRLFGAQWKDAWVKRSNDL